MIDEETRLPVEGALVGLAGGAPGGSFIACPWCDETDADGRYRLENIAIPFDQDSTRGGHHGRARRLLGATPAPDRGRSRERTVSRRRPRAIAPKVWITATGVVRDAITHDPIPGASVGVQDGSFPGGPGDLTDADGRYQIDRVQLGFRNAAQDVQITASAGGYLTEQATERVSAGLSATHDFDLIPECPGATISGRVVNAETQAPIQGADVTGGGLRTITDADGNYRLENVAVGTNNSPIAVDIVASAQGFHTQTKRVTVFCGASISLDFGRQIQMTDIEGYVRDVSQGLPGTPMEGVFIGSGFGGATTTDENGYYLLEDAPLSPDGSPRTWDVTADPVGFDAMTATVTVRAGRDVQAGLRVRRRTDP